MHIGLVLSLHGRAQKGCAGRRTLVLHRSYADGSWFRGREYDNDFVRQCILAYAKSMGVATAPIAYAERLPHSHVQPLTRSQIREWDLGTADF